MMTTKFFATLAIYALAAAYPSLATASKPAPALVYHPTSGNEPDEETRANIEEFVASLSPLQGAVTLKGAKATLEVPATHYFLGPDDARAVLVDAWDNPPDESILGMIFPIEHSPIDNETWGATISFNDDGYVSDDDANNIDYDEMMRDMQSSQQENNAWRKENGYAPIKMIGWAESPTYNPDTHKLYWAKEMKFGEMDDNTLNYDIRVLGRSGTLVISFIASMDQIAAVRQSAPTVLEMAEFKTGSTYADYRPGIDKKAAYGIAGLIGGAVIAKKTGLLMALLLFGKKFIVIILAGVAGAFGAVKRFFTGREQ